jgi:hypothetical protein
MLFFDFLVFSFSPFLAFDHEVRHGCLNSSLTEVDDEYLFGDFVDWVLLVEKIFRLLALWE